MLVAVLIANPDRPSITDAVLAETRAVLRTEHQPRILHGEVAAELLVPGEPGAAASLTERLRNALAGEPIDLAVLPADAHRRKRLFLADMDSTMIEQECIDELAGTLGLKDSDSRHLVKGALLHDIGKAKIPLAILNKPAPLTPDERLEMDRHPALGHDMLRGETYDPLILSVVRSHHEFLDGSGYPDGLRGRDIPDLVRLITICDIFAALIEARPYKAPKSVHEAYAILERMGPKLDADLVRAFGPVAVACETPVRATA
ncbi:MAG: HD domain-containing protein [Hyphomicrobiales bacterium]